MTPGERVAREAEKYVGVRENPLGSNRGNPYPDRWERPWGMGYGWPWCGAFAAAMYKAADVDDQGIGHPATAYMAKRAVQVGAEITRPIPGCYIIWPGKHTGIVIRDLGGNVALTVEGNSSDGVYYRRRAYGPGTGVMFAAPLAVRVGNRPKPADRNYYLEDTAAKPVLRGPWSSRAARERVIAKLPASKRNVRRVRLGKGYAFYEGPRRVYGPWDDRDARDAARKTLEVRLGRTLRPYSRLAPSAAAVAADALGKTV